MSTDLPSLIARIQELLIRRDFPAAEQAIQYARWQVPGHPMPVRMAALLKLLRGEPEQALADLAQGARSGDREDGLWLAAASTLNLAHPGAFDAQAFFVQLGVDHLKQSPYLDYPLEVHLETLSRCNAACGFCPYPRLERLGQAMSDALIDKILGDLGDIPSHLPFGLAPFKVNEPLLDKRLFRICADINRRLPNARPRIFTNGSPLTEANIERLAEIKHLQHLWISLNECEPEPYQQLMGIPLDKTLTALDRLHRAADEKRFPWPVIVSRVRSRTEADARFISFVRERFPLFSLALLPHAAWAGQADDPEGLPAPAAGCQRWFELSIMSTGKVALCCMDGEGKHVIGDVTHTHALTIYNDPAYRRLRENTPTRLEAGAPCNRCST